MVTNTSPWQAIQSGGSGWFNRNSQQVSPSFIQSSNVSIFLWFFFASVNMQKYETDYVQLNEIHVNLIS